MRERDAAKRETKGEGKKDDCAGGPGDPVLMRRLAGKFGTLESPAELGRLFDICFVIELWPDRLLV